MKHVTSIKQFLDKELLSKLFTQAEKFQSQNPSEYSELLKNKVVATLFYEPSTRTRLSFETATLRLGAEVVSTENAGQFSSAAKGESLEDTIKTINGYADAIVLRHPALGAAESAARVSEVPIINAGDGAGEHPTQALLDLYTIQQAYGKVDGLKVGLVGDLLNGRTIHSLVQLLSIYDVELILVSPPSLQLPDSYLTLIQKNKIRYRTLSGWDNELKDLDVVYMTRVQKERFETLKEYEAVKDSFILTAQEVSKMKKSAIIMHPLPRVNEISTVIDSDPRARYFEQAANGLYVRMALLEILFDN